MIEIIPNFMSNEDIDTMISETAFDQFTPVDYSPGVLTQVPYKPSSKLLFEKLRDRHYGNLQSVEMLLYREGSHSPIHIDKSSFDGGKKWIRTGILFCSDTYEGGELKFPNLDMSVKLPKGSFISFPAGSDSQIYSHGVSEIISGERISLVVRYCG
jgi:hypothetical protein